MCEEGKAAAKTASDPETLVTWGRVFKAFCNEAGPVRRMLLAGMTIPLVAMLTGYLSVAYYSSTLLKGAAGQRMAFLATVVMGTVKLLVGIVVVSVLDRCGRRPLLLASMITMMVACCWLAVAFGMGLHWLWLASGFCLFMAGFELGMGPLMFLYPAEVLNTAWRSKASGVAIFLSRIIGAPALFFFPLIIAAVGPSVTFGLQSAMNLALGVFVWMVIYETKGLTLEGMAHLFGEPDKDKELP